MMDQLVYLITDSDEMCLGTVEEILHSDGAMCFNSILSDVVGEIFGNPVGHYKLFAIELRQPRE